MNNSPEELLIKNLQLTEEIYQLTKKTHRYIVFAQIWAIIQFLIIIGPIIAAFIYLPKIVNKVTNAYFEVLPFNSERLKGLVDSNSNVDNNVDR